MLYKNNEQLILAHLALNGSFVIVIAIVKNIGQNNLKCVHVLETFMYLHTRYEVSVIFTMPKYFNF